MPNLKVCLLGDSGVGKTSLSNRLLGLSPSDGHCPTIGANSAQVTYRDTAFQLWDTAGQERYRAVTPLYVRGSTAALVLFDRTSAPSLESVRQWAELVHDSGRDIHIILVGSKTDLEGSQVVVSHEEAKRVVDELGLKQYIAVSSLSGFGVDVLLDAIYRTLTDVETPETFPINSTRARGSAECC
jgi:Ras-related protein Rab-6A